MNYVAAVSNQEVAQVFTATQVKAVANKRDAIHMTASRQELKLQDCLIKMADWDLPPWKKGEQNWNNPNFKIEGYRNTICAVGLDLITMTDSQKYGGICRDCWKFVNRRNK